MHDHVRHESENASLCEHSSQVAVWRVHRGHSLISRKITRLTRYNVVEVVKSDSQPRMVHEHTKTLLVLGHTAVHVLPATAVFEHIRCKYADHANQPNKSKHKPYAPGTSGGPFFPEGVDDEYEQKRDHDRAKHRQQRHADGGCQPN